MTASFSEIMPANIQPSPSGETLRPEAQEQRRHVQELLAREQHHARK